MSNLFPERLGVDACVSVMRACVAVYKETGKGPAALVFAAALLGSILLGILAIRAGLVAEHRRWMRRAFALALGPPGHPRASGLGGTDEGGAA